MNISEDIEYSIDIALEDERTNFTGFEYSNYVDYGNVVTSSIGMVCDLLIIFAILKNQRMKSRRNILLMYWAIFDFIGYELLIGFIGRILYETVGSSDSQFDMCVVHFSTGLLKFNCVVLLLLLVSTTVARLEFIKEKAFQWCICIGTLLLYITNVSLCYYVSPFLSIFKFAFVFLTLLVVLLVKEVNMCCKARRDDPVSEGTKVKINLVRIFMYNHVLVVLASVLLFHIFDFYYISFVMEYSLHLTPMYMLVYLCVVDLNFRNAFRHCCRKADRELDATVVYNVDGNKETVDFTRI